MTKNTCSFASSLIGSVLCLIRIINNSKSLTHVKMKLRPAKYNLHDRVCKIKFTSIFRFTSPCKCTVKNIYIQRPSAVMNSRPCKNV